MTRMVILLPYQCLTKPIDPNVWHDQARGGGTSLIDMLWEQKPVARSTEQQRCTALVQSWGTARQCDAAVLQDVRIRPTKAGSTLAH